MDNISLDFLAYFIAFAKAGSLSGAAEETHVSQSALTKAMQKLEDGVGVPLFLRHGNRLELSEAGRAFLEGAKATLSTCEGAVEMAKQAHRKANSIRLVSALPGVYEKELPLLLACFQDKEISLKLAREKEAASLLAKGEADGGFFLLPPSHNYGSKSFGLRLGIALFEGDPLLKEGKISLDDLEKRAFLKREGAGEIDEIARKRFPDARFSNKDGKFPLPYFLIEGEKARDGYHAKPIDGNLGFVRLCFAYPKEKEECFLPFLERLVD